MNSIAQIVPLLRMPLSCGVFDYRITSNIASSARVGQLVLINLRGKNIQGIIWNIRPCTTNDNSLKPLEKILKEYDFVSQNQRHFFEWFSKRHIISLPSACATFIPRQPKLRRKTITRKNYGDMPRLMRISCAPFQGGQQIIIAHDWHAITSLILMACETIKIDEQLLILSPSLHDISMIEWVLAPFRSSVAIITGNESMSGLAESYDLLAQGFCTIALSTRLALGWNFPNLSRIIMIDPEARDYKQYDHNPRYDTRALVAYLNNQRSCATTFISSAPNCELITEKNNDSYIVVSSQQNISSLPIVNLRDEFRSGNSSFINDQLAEQIALARMQDKHALLFINKKGFGGSVRCSSCQDIVLCTECYLPMRISLRTNILRCTSCATTRPLGVSCPRCQSHSFDFSGIGVERIAVSLRNRFPNTPITEITADTTHPELSNSSLIIATTHFFSWHWPWINHVGCIGIIGADPVPSLIDFRSCEYQWQTLMRLIRLGDTFAIPTILQAFDPYSVPLQTLAARDWERFAQWQCEQRQRFHWPPWGRVIKILARHQTLIHNESVDLLIRNAREALVSLQDRISIFRTRSMHFDERPYILVRIKGNYVSLDPLPQVLQQFLESISSEWLIDIDPATF